MRRSVVAVVVTLAVGVIALVSVRALDGSEDDPAGVAAGAWTVVTEPPIEMEWSRVGGITTWTGERMLTFGGTGIAVGCGESGPFDDGASFDPATGAWTTIATSPLGRRADPAWAWTGDELIVWGGQDALGCMGDPGVSDSGARYDPAIDTWDDLPAAPIGARMAMASAWTGEQLLIWGGIDFPLGPSGGPVAGGPGPQTEDREIVQWSDGAAFDPATAIWQPLPPAPDGLLGPATGAWTGGRFVVITQDAAAAHDPATGDWTLLPRPAGAEFGQMVGVAGHALLTTPPADLQEVAPTDWWLLPDDADEWQSIPAPPQAAVINSHPVTSSGPGLVLPTVRAFGERVFVSGLVAGFEGEEGCPPTTDLQPECPSAVPTRTGSAVFDVATATWTQLPVAPFGYRFRPQVAWTGDELILWGGVDSERLDNPDDSYSPPQEDPSRRGAMIPLELETLPSVHP